MENTAANSTAWCSSVTSVVLPSSVVLGIWWLHKLASVQPSSVVLPTGSGATNCRIYAVLSARCTQLQPSGGTGCVRMRTCAARAMVDEVVLPINVLSVAIARRPRLSTISR